MYSPFFQTLYDETGPAGNLGRGTHYSVLRAVTWHGPHLDPLPNAELVDFAVIWDADHYKRVIDVAHTLYFEGLLAPVRFIGERKGVLHVLIAPDAGTEWDSSALTEYRDRLREGVEHSDLNDWWDVAPVSAVGGSHSIVHADKDDVDVYLRCIQMLWRLGVKPRPVGERTAGDGQPRTKTSPKSDTPAAQAEATATEPSVRPTELTEKGRLKAGGYRSTALRARRDNLTIHTLSKDRGEHLFKKGKRQDAWDRLRDGMKVRDWCAICKPEKLNGTYLIALYLYRQLIELR